MKRLGYVTSLLNCFLCVSTFTAACDLGIAGYLVGLWELGSFYPEHGEKYFGTLFGIAGLGWDGIAHLLLQGFLCYKSLRNQDLGLSAFILSGSVSNSMMPVLVGAAATDKYSADVELSTALSVPYVLVPIMLAYSLTAGSSDAKKESNKGEKKKKSDNLNTSKFNSAMLVLSHGALVVLHVLRAMASLNSEAPVAQWWRNDVEPVLQQQDGSNVMLLQSLESFFYLIPYHCLSIWEAFTRVHHGKAPFLGVKLQLPGHL